MQNKLTTTAIKITVTVMISVFTLCVAYVGFILTLLSGKGAYALLILTVTLGILLLVPLTVFKMLERRGLILSWGIMVIYTAAFIGVNSGFNYYNESIPVISEDDSFLNDYKPFEEHSYLAVLQKPASLRIPIDPPSLDGAKALYPLYAALAQAVYPKEVLAEDGHTNSEQNTVACTNTINAYGRLAEGTVDIIFAAPPSAEQAAYAKENGTTLKLTPIGREAFIFFVNAGNPVDTLTIEEVQQIYSGEITNWKDLGGKNKKIQAFQRNEGSGSQTIFLKFMDGKNIMTPPETDTQYGMGEAISRVSDYKNYSNAIGFSFKFFAETLVNNDGIKLIKVNGVYPSKENIQNGSYPLVADFYAVTALENNSGNINLFLEWILSPEGQELVDKTGYIPLR